MYTVYVDGKQLYVPHLQKEGYGIFNPKITMELNKAGSFTFQLPPNNVMYDSINKLKSIITVMQDGVEIFRGRAIADEKDFYNRKNVTCEGELAFLLDSQQRPYSHKTKLSDLFRNFINVHNAHVDEWKIFKIGEITVDGKTDNIIRENSDYSCTFDEINEKLLNTNGGYLRTRLSDGLRYIDYVKDYGKVSSQIIEFGVNLLDISEYISAEDVFTVLIPLGAEVESTDTNKRLDITSVNGGKDYIEDAAAISLFGRIEKVNQWDDVTNADNLLKKAKAYLSENIEMAVTLNVKAIDLHLIDVDVEKIELGDYVRVISIPHNLDKYFLCSRIVLDLVNPDKSEYTFGVTFKTLTEKQMGNAKTMQSTILSVQSTAQLVKQNSSQVQDAVEQMETIITSIPSDYVSTSEFNAFKNSVSSKLASVYSVKGNVSTYSLLPADGNSIGDVFNILDTGANYVWTEYGWDKLSEIFDTTAFITKEEVETNYVDKITFNHLSTRMSDIEERLEGLL